VSTILSPNYEKDVHKAIVKYETANNIYVSVIKRLINSELLTTEETALFPKICLNIDSLKEFEEAWVIVQEAGKKLRRDFMKLYSTDQ
jgi:hypothetical protein